MGIESDAGYQAYRERVFDFLWREVEPLMDEVERAGDFPAASAPRAMGSPPPIFFALSSARKGKA